MKKVYYLSTCDTCKRIMKEVGVDDQFDQQDIKHNKITEAQLLEMKDLSGSFESLFSKKARKYKELNLKERDLSDQEIKDLILEEYTFLKRPVFIIDDQIFIGNSSKNVDQLKERLSKN